MKIYLAIDFKKDKEFVDRILVARERKIQAKSLRSTALFFCLFFCLSGLFAQKYKLLEGKVTHPNLVVAGIHVINADRGLAEITDINGFFQISVAVGERLVFSGVQYKKRELLISAEIFALDGIKVYLEAFVTS